MPTIRSNRLLLIVLMLIEPEWRALRGQAPLGRVFWIYGVFGSAVLALLFVLAREAGRPDLRQVLLLGFLLYTAAILVAVWRCSANAASPWGHLARALTVAWALNTMFLIGFLQVELLIAAPGGEGP